MKLQARTHLFLLAIAGSGNNSSRSRSRSNSRSIPRIAGGPQTRGMTSLPIHGMVGKVRQAISVDTDAK